MKRSADVQAFFVTCIICLGSCAWAQESANSIAPCGNLKIFKYNDHDASGTWNSVSEQRLAGFRFNVTGPVSFSAVTNVWGEAYRFCIPFGEYTITEQVPFGWVPTTPNPVHLTVDEEDLADISFGNKQMPAPTTTSTTSTTTTTSTSTTSTTTTTTSTSTTTTTTSTTSTTSTTLCGNLKVFKYNDYNGNGIWEQGEPTLAGVRFNITGPKVFQMVSDSNGEAFAFCIPRGVYAVTEIINAGWVNTTANPQTIDLASEDIQEARFGDMQIPVTTTTSTTTESSTTTTSSTPTTLAVCGDVVLINAKGVEAAGIPPIMQLWIDGRMKAQWNVSSLLRNYTYDIALCGGHNIDVVYTNDCSTNGSADRNLYVYYAIAAGKLVYSNDTSVKYDRGIGSEAFDGMDVSNASALMDMSGALRYKVNGGLQENCSELWWFDNDDPVCNRSMFCGSYAYYGLRTFGSEAECLEGLNESCALAGDYAPCGQVTLQEVIALINRWVAGSARLSEVIDLINAY
jgi:hypothetical protein